MTLAARIETAIGRRPESIGPLTGGCIGEVYQVVMPSGERLVVKVDQQSQPRLDIEGYMLTYLASHSILPVPKVFHTSPRLLIMTFIEGTSHFPAGAQAHAAELLAAMHNISAPHYGLERDTLIGGLPQPNPPTDAWLPFFCQHRLLYMAQQGIPSGRLPASFLPRLTAFCEQIDRWLIEPQQPSLIHGDVWTTNVLAAGNRITGFLDPAIYYADPEIELAFTTLFGTFGPPFFERYQELRPLRPGFFEERRDIYNLYPLLVHVRLFGGRYVASVDRTLRRFGF